MESAYNFPDNADSNRVPHGTQNIQRHPETNEVAPATVTPLEAEADAVRTTEGISLVTDAHKKLSRSSSKEVRLKPSASTGQAASSKKRRSNDPHEAEPESQSTTPAGEYGTALKAMPVGQPVSGASSVAESLTASSEVRAGTHGDGRGEAGVAGLSRKRSPDDEGEAEEAHDTTMADADDTMMEDADDTMMDDAAYPVQPHETYKQRLAKKIRADKPDSEESTTFKKRRVKGSHTVALEQVVRQMKDNPLQTEKDKRMIQSLQARLTERQLRRAQRKAAISAERTARLAEYAARLKAGEQGLEEPPEDSSPQSSTGSDEMSEATHAVFEDATASVHRNAAALAPRTNVEDSGGEHTDGEIIVYPVRPEDPPTREPSYVTSGGDQVPDSELENTSFSDVSPSDVEMETANTQASANNSDSDEYLSAASRMSVDQDPQPAPVAPVASVSITTVASASPVAATPIVDPSTPVAPAAAPAAPVALAPAAAPPIAVPYGSPVAAVASPVAAPIASPITALAAAAEPAASTTITQQSTLDTVVASMRRKGLNTAAHKMFTATSAGTMSGVDTSRPPQDPRTHQAVTPPTTKVTGKKDSAASAGPVVGFDVGDESESPMLIDPSTDPKPAPASRSRAPRSQTTPIGQSTARGTARGNARGLGPSAGITTSSSSGPSPSFPISEQKPGPESQLSAVDDDAVPPLPKPRPRYHPRPASSSSAHDPVSPIGTRMRQSALLTPRAGKNSAKLSSDSEDSTSEADTASPTPRAVKHMTKVEASLDTHQSASSPLSSPTPAGRKHRSQPKYERPTAPTPSRQAPPPLLLVKGEPSSDDDDRMATDEPRSSLSEDGNRTPRAPTFIMTKAESPRSDGESAGLVKVEPSDSDDEAAALLTRVESPTSKEESSILRAISPERAEPSRLRTPHPLDDVPSPRPPMIFASTRANRRGGRMSMPSRGIRGGKTTSQGSHQASSSGRKQSGVTVESTGSNGGRTATVASMSGQGSSSSPGTQSRVAAEGTGAQGVPATNVASTSGQGSSLTRGAQSRVAAEGTGAQGVPAASVATPSSPGSSTRRHRSADGAQIYATKTDVDLLKVVLEGLSTEVRAITGYLKQGGEKQGESPPDSSAAGPSKSKPSSSKSKAKSSSKGASFSRTNSKGGAGEDDEEYIADSEEVEKLKQPVVHRSPEENQLSLDVQAHALTLLGRASRNAPFPKRTIATLSQVRGFDPDEGECCTAKRFRIDIDGTPGSPYNLSAARVFAKSFMTVAQFQCRDRRRIEAAFKSHFKALQRQYDIVGREQSGDTSDEDEDMTSKKKSSSSAGNPNNRWFESSSTSKGKGKETATASAGPDRSKRRRTAVDRKAHSRYQRKSKLWEQRYNIVCRYRLLRKHAWIVQKLGVDGMSSDEEEEGAPIRRYWVFVKPWRSTLVTDFLRILDALHRRYRQKAGSGTTRGSPPRLRYLCPDTSTSEAVRGLPINAYAETWYKALKGLKKDEYEEKAKVAYDFTIDESVIDAVAQYRQVEMDGHTYV